ncbi:ankyrin repeat domain-containing protein SOWAHC [Lampris incognitus]|uniref:ankyrin repeat domain-containing protein SOWAHC n=1 Tax=Lampris incognitus TaxID=2546036 RepID=UPI0024B4EF49|nr:ankyrin repeat domain-containing protein SOWAHC [Lampris incognitus]
MASGCTERAVLEFLTGRGGRVRQMELIDYFASIWENDSEKDATARETLTRVVDHVACLTLENGVHVVCLKEGCMDSATRTHADGHDQERNGNAFGAGDAPLSGAAGPPGDVDEASDCNVSGDPCSGGRKRGKDAALRGPASDPKSSGNERPSESEEPVAACREGGTSGTPAWAGGEVKLRERRRRESAPAIGAELDPAHPGGHHGQVRGARRVSRGSQRAVLTSCLSEDGAWDGLDTGGDGSTPKGSRRNFIELMMSSSPQVRRSLIHRSSRLRDSVKSDGDCTSLLSSLATDEDCASVTLDPLEHEWMLCASDGQWDSLQPLLATEPSLVAKRDFVTGFTCLHWAAKQGKAELLSQLLGFAKESMVPVDVNARSSAGYTPLHLAAMHGHTQVVRVLLSDWEADPETRDYSGRRAIQYLPLPVATELREDRASVSPGAESDTENADGGSRGRGWRLPKVLQSNLNPLRLLNPPAEGAEEVGVRAGKAKGGVQRKPSLSRLNTRLQRGHRRTQIIHSTSFRDSEEVGGGREEFSSSPLRARPLSNLFG